MHSENLVNLLNALSALSIYVIEEDTHQLLYFNQRCQETGRGRARIGVKCHEVWPELCTDCPLDNLNGNSSGRTVRYDPLLKTTVDITANRILWDGHRKAVVITASPHMLSYEEEQGFQKIEQMYAQSLVTVFDECIIANLTTNYYVNCQKDMMWSGIPEHGNFDAENRIYAKKTLHPEDLPLFNENFSREAMLRLFESGKHQITKRLRRLTENGVYHMVEFTAAKIGQMGESECWCVLVYRDVQEDYLLEQQRSLEISQLATAAQTAYQMLIAVNLTQNTYHMLEYDRYPVKKPVSAGYFNDLIAEELATVHPDYRTEFIQKFSRRSLIDALTHGKHIISMEVPHLGEDGIYHWHFTQVVGVESAISNDLIEITLSRNIDEERRLREETLEKERRAKQILENALQKAKKASSAKSDFLSKMSHDIRTPLNAILGITELAQMHTGEEDRLKDYLSKIAGAGTHLLGLINEVLDVSKIESGSYDLIEDEFNLYDLAKETIEMVRLTLEAKGQSLTADIDSSLHPQVMGDAGRIRQILVNILENASKYTGEKGEITFRLKELQKEERQAGTYQFVIEDTGIGMKPEYIKHIFEPFSRADDSRISKISGTGLGMTIVQNLINMMGGKIQVESEYAKGSRFTVTLCLTKCALHTSASLTGQPKTEESVFHLRALLVEDNELNRQIAAEMLELLGAQVETAENGQEAVDAVISHPPFYYDIVFMDIQMPVLNGYDAAKKIRGSAMEGIDRLPIIAMTADAFAEDARQALLAGMNGHLAKPISIGLLKNALANSLVWKRQSRNANEDAPTV